jgi:membrane protease subunit HflK
MLTGDENIVEADCAVFWRIKDAGQFLFKRRRSRAAVKVAPRRAARGHRPHADPGGDVRQAPADRRPDARVAADTARRENAGIEITQVQLQRVDPPQHVIDAFNDVQRARADQERARNEAEAYANDICRARAARPSTSPGRRGLSSSQVGQPRPGRRQGLPVGLPKLRQGQGRHGLAALSRQRRRGAEEGHPVIIDTSGKGVSGVVPYLPLTDKSSFTDKNPPASKEVGK